MNRDIKFRAWHKIGQYMMNDFLINCETGEPMTFNEDNELVVNNELEVMQYTRLKDKNGNEIYVGDIVKCTELRNDKINEWISAVEYDDCDYIVHESKTCDCSLNLFFGGINKYPLTEIEVIGNIYKNSELLKAI